MNKFPKPLSLVLLGILLFTNNVFSQEKRKYTTAKIQGESPKIDGFVNDSVWNQVNWENTFTQYNPLNGGSPSQQTAFKILYDKNYLYIAIRAYDSVPENIVKRMSRRDGFQGDWVEIAFDSYHDYNTAYSFTASAAGVKSDEIYTNDELRTDHTWDPIWYLKTSIDKLGWVAEIKIPFTQLRFSEESNQIWGLQVKRYVHRKDERSLWQHIPNQQAGYVSRFGELNGLKNIKPKKQFDITPYTVAEYVSFEADEDNPFTDGQESIVRAGLDAKIGLTNNLTLDLTINPDFGQVEADPSEVNLSAFESYYDEKRLFFIEGRNIYNFPLRGGVDNLFYSRRIGRSPSYYPESYNYIDAPNNSSIFGAAKITGKTKNGLSIGILESVTNVENARFEDTNGIIQDYKAEPLTNYFVSRVEKDFDKGNTKLGGIFTATNRKITDDNLKILPLAAYTGGINFDHSWNDRKYNFSVKLMGSNIQGDKAAISELQTASSRYFQRPDANHLEFNPNLTSLSGHAGNVSLGKTANGGWSYTTWFSWQSPGFELNDIGYLRFADDLTEVFWVEYKFPNPFSFFRNLSIEADQFSSFDYSGKYLGMGGDIDFRAQFTNYWSLSMGASSNTKTLEKTLLRGGPMFLSPRGYRSWAQVSTDGRKKLNLSAYTSFSWKDEASRLYKYFSINLTYRPIDQLRISVNSSLSFNTNQLQFIDILTIEEQDRYFLAEIKQKTFATHLRIDYSITPDLSLQYYAQPFISNGEYSNFKYVTNPIASEYSDRFQITQPDQNYDVDINNDNIADGNIGNPDFKFLQFQSNLVARWEYRPGSIVYLVWSQNKTDVPENNYAFDLNTDLIDMHSIFPHNIFLAKLSYRIPI